MRRKDWEELLKADEKDHAKYSPSSLKYREACPHFVNTESDHPTTAMGNRCHYAIEHADIDILQSEEELDFVKIALGFLYHEFKIKSKIEGDKILWDFNGWEVFFETRVFTEFHECHGTVDVLIYRKGEFHLVDWKFGLGFQGDASENPQGQGYFQGAWRFLTTLDQFTPFKKASISFVYPQLEEVTTHYIADPAKEFERYAARTADILEKISLVEGGAKLHSYDRDNCIYCKNRTTCPAFAEVKEIFMVAHKGMLAKAPKSFTLNKETDPVTVGLVLDTIDLMTARCAELKSQAIAWATEYETNPEGYQLIVNRGKLSTIDPETIYNQCIEAGVTHEQFMLTCVNVSAPTAIDLIARRIAERDGVTIKKASAETREELQEEGIVALGDSFTYLKRTNAKKK